MKRTWAETAKQTLALFLSASFLTTPSEAASVTRVAADLQARPAFVPSVALTPPGGLGHITDVYNGPNSTGSAPRLVVLIQDLHVNVGVQRNIAGLLDFLTTALNEATGRRPSASLPFALAVEGADGPVDTSAIARTPDDAVKRAGLRYLLREGELTGMEYFAAQRGLPHVLVGVEDGRYYQAHRDLFRQTLAQREPVVSALSTVQSDLRRLRGRLYSRPLRALQKSIDAYEKGRLSPLEFSQRLLRSLRDVDLPTGYPALARFLTNAKARETAPAVLQPLIARFLTEVSPRLSDQERTTLRYLAKREQGNDYLLYLRDLIYRHNLFVAVPPTLAQYLEMVYTSQGADMDEVTQDLQRLAETARLKTAVSSQERDLVQVENDLALLLKVANLQATEPDARAFGPRLSAFTALCRTLLKTNGLASSFDDAAIERLLATSLDYYAMAVLRNKPMIDRTLLAASWVEAPVQAAVLVTGGFHTAALAAMLRKRGVSYVVITPAVERLDDRDHALYVKRLMGVHVTEAEAAAAAQAQRSLHAGYAPARTAALLNAFRGGAQRAKTTIVSLPRQTITTFGHWAAERQRRRLERARQTESAAFRRRGEADSVPRSLWMAQHVLPRGQRLFYYVPLAPLILLLADDASFSWPTVRESWRHSVAFWSSVARFHRAGHTWRSAWARANASLVKTRRATNWAVAWARLSRLGARRVTRTSDEDQQLFEAWMAEGLMSLVQRDEILDLADSPETTGRFLRTFEREIRGGHLDTLLALARAERGATYLKFSLFTNRPNRLAILLDNKPLFDRYGLAEFSLFVDTNREGSTNDTFRQAAFGGDVTAALQRLKSLEDAADHLGLIAMAAILLSFDTAKKSDGIRVRAFSPDDAVKATRRLSKQLKTFGYGDAKSVRQFIRERRAEHQWQLLTTDQSSALLEVENLGDLVDRLGVPTVLRLSQGATVRQLLTALELLGPLQARYPVTQLASLQLAEPPDAPNLVVRLSRLDVEAWARFLVATGKVPPQALKITALLLKNLTSLQSHTLQTEMFQTMAVSDPDDSAMNLVEQWIVDQVFQAPESRERMRQYYASGRTDIQRSMMARALGWLYEHANALPIAETLLQKERASDLPRALNLLPALDGLLRSNILTEDEVRTLVASGDVHASWGALLPTKIEAAFGVRFEEMSEDAKQALDDVDFLVDLFNFQHRYADNPNAKEHLRQLISAYFRNGADGVRAYKRTQSLAARQAPQRILDALDRPEVWKELRTGPVAADSRVALFDSRFRTTLQNYDAHRQEQSFDVGTLQRSSSETLERLTKELSQLTEAAQSEPLRAALRDGNIAVLEGLKEGLSGRDLKRRNAAIAVLKRRAALDQENALARAVDVIEAIRGIGDLDAGLQPAAVQALYDRWAEAFPALLASLRTLKAELDQKEKPEAQIVAEMAGLLLELQAATRQTAGSKDVSAEISFDLKETLKIGRYGASGQGNCQSSTHSGDYNQGLMSFIPDAHELIALMRDAAGEVVGFVLFHGVYRSDGSFVYVRENVYTNRTDMAEEQHVAAVRLSALVEDALGVPVVTASKNGSSPEALRIPPSSVKRYLDSLGGSVESPESSASVSVRTSEDQGGALKGLGPRSVMDEDALLVLGDRHRAFEEQAALERPLPGAEWEEVEGARVQVIRADLPAGVYAYHVPRPKGPPLVVLANSLARNVEEEAIFHEVREAHWRRHINPETGVFYTQHEAHVLASAEQAERYSFMRDLTKFHLLRLADMSADDLRALLAETEADRAWHHGLLAGAGLNVDKAKQYEEILRDQASYWLYQKTDRIENLSPTQQRVFEAERAIKRGNQLVSMGAFAQAVAAYQTAVDALAPLKGTIHADRPAVGARMIRAELGVTSAKELAAANPSRHVDLDALDQPTVAVTHAGRLTFTHAYIETLMASHPGPGLVVDVGLGYEPVTTAELADHLKGTRMIGVDIVVPEAMVTLGEGDAEVKAFFDANGQLLYAYVLGRPLSAPQVADVLDAYRRLRAHAPVEGGVLTLKPFAPYARPNLEFRQGGFALPLAPGEKASVVRLFNVIQYYPGRESEVFEALLPFVEEGGHLVVGDVNSNLAFDRTEFLVLQKRGSRFVPLEVGTRVLLENGRALAGGMVQGATFEPYRDLWDHVESTVSHLWATRKDLRPSGPAYLNAVVEALQADGLDVRRMDRTLLFNVDDTGAPVRHKESSSGTARVSARGSLLVGGLSIAAALVSTLAATAFLPVLGLEIVGVGLAATALLLSLAAALYLGPVVRMALIRRLGWEQLRPSNPMTRDAFEALVLAEGLRPVADGQGLMEVDRDRMALHYDPRILREQPRAALVALLKFHEAVHLSSFQVSGSRRGAGWRNEVPAYAVFGFKSTLALLLTIMSWLSDARISLEDELIVASRVSRAYVPARVRLARWLADGLQASASEAAEGFALAVVLSRLVREFRLQGNELSLAVRITLDVLDQVDREALEGPARVARTIALLNDVADAELHATLPVPSAGPLQALHRQWGWFARALGLGAELLAARLRLYPRLVHPKAIQGVAVPAGLVQEVSSSLQDPALLALFQEVLANVSSRHFVLQDPNGSPRDWDEASVRRLLLFLRDIVDAVGEIPPGILRPEDRFPLLIQRMIGAAGAYTLHDGAIAFNRPAMNGRSALRVEIGQDGVTNKNQIRLVVVHELIHALSFRKSPSTGLFRMSPEAWEQVAALVLKEEERRTLDVREQLEHQWEYGYAPAMPRMERVAEAITYAATGDYERGRQLGYLPSRDAYHQIRRIVSEALFTVNGVAWEFNADETNCRWTHSGEERPLPGGHALGLRPQGDAPIHWSFWPRVLALDGRAARAHWRAWWTGTLLSDTDRQTLRDEARKAGVENLVFDDAARWSFGGEYVPSKDAIVINGRFRLADAQAVLGHELLERELVRSGQRVNEFWTIVQEPGSRLLTYTLMAVGGVVGGIVAVGLVWLGAASGVGFSAGFIAATLSSVTLAAQAEREAPLLASEPSAAIRALMRSPDSRRRWDDRDSLKAFTAARAFLTAA